MAVPYADTPICHKSILSIIQWYTWWVKQTLLHFSVHTLTISQVRIISPICGHVGLLHTYPSLWHLMSRMRIPQGVTFTKESCSGKHGGKYGQPYAHAWCPYGFQACALQKLRLQWYQTFLHHNVIKMSIQCRLVSSFGRKSGHFGEHICGSLPFSGFGASWTTPGLEYGC